MYKCMKCGFYSDVCSCEDNEDDRIEIDIMDTILNRIPLLEKKYREKKKEEKNNIRG